MTSQFASELIRAANEIDRVSLFERRRFLDRSASSIRDMCEQIGIGARPPSEYPIGLEFRIRAMAREIGRHTDDEVAKAFLDSAKALNDLRHVLDALTT